MLIDLKLLTVGLGSYVKVFCFLWALFSESYCVITMQLPEARQGLRQGLQAEKCVKFCSPVNKIFADLFLIFQIVNCRIDLTINMREWGLFNKRQPHMLSWWAPLYTISIPPDLPHQLRDMRYGLFKN